jgi:hypothetical protein
MIFRTFFRVLAFVVLALVAWAYWLWLFYGQRYALPLHRDYVDAALVSVALIGVALSFQRARRDKSIAGASIETGVTLLGCAGVVATAYMMIIAIAYLVGRFAP